MAMNGWQQAVGALQTACRDAFGVPVRYVPSMEKRMELAGRAIDLTGIFDDARETVSLMGGPGMDAVVPRPVLEIRIADLGIDPMAGDEVTVGSLTIPQESGMGRSEGSPEGGRPGMAGIT